MDPKSSEEVMRTISADLRQRGLTHEAAAQKLGLKSKQTLSNLLSQKKYLSGVQALKFHEAFGYNQKFLMSGEGSLMNDDALRYESYKENTPRDLLTCQPGASELGLLRLYFRRIIQAWGHPEAIKILRAYQLYESCADVYTLMAFMAEVEKSLQTLEKEKQIREQTTDGQQ